MATGIVWSVGHGVKWSSGHLFNYIKVCIIGHRRAILGDRLADQPARIDQCYNQRVNFRRVLHSDYVLLALLTLPAALPLLLNAGLPNTADGVLHLYRTVELDRAWRDGVFYPRIAPDFAYGYGYPIFNYYAPLFYFLSQVLHLLALNFEWGMKAAIVFMLFFFPLGMYLLAREWLSREAALVAGVAYLYVPYRFYETYIQGDYPQLLALAIVPFCLWAVTPALTRPRSLTCSTSLRGADGTARTAERASTPSAAPVGEGGGDGSFRFFTFIFCYTALVLAHNITALISTPLIGAYILFMLFTHRTSRIMYRASRIALAIVLAIGLSAFFWLPALGEQRYVHIEKLTRGFFDFHSFFISPSELLAPNSAPDLAAVNPYIPFNLGASVVALSVIGLLLALARHVRSRPVTLTPQLFLAACALALAALTLPLSAPLWEHVPLLVLVEFPWRFVGVAAIPLAMLVGFAAQVTSDEWRVARMIAIRHSSFVCTIFIVLLVLDCFVYLFPRTPFIAYNNPSLADIAKFEIDSQALGTTSASEYLPLWTQRRMYDSPLTSTLLNDRVPDHLQREALPASVRVETLTQTVMQDVYRFNSVGVLTIHLRRIYFPGWTATIDGTPAPLDLLAPNGTMRVQMPAGAHIVAFTFGETNLRLIADGISLVALVVVSGLALWIRRQTAHGRRQTTDDPRLSSVVRRRSSIVVTLAIIVFYFIAPRIGFVRVSSLPTIVGAQHARQDNFGDELQLLAYDLPSASVNTGDPLALTLYWQPLRRIESDYAVFVHLDSPLTLETVAQDVNAHPGNISTIELPLSLYVRDPHVVSVPHSVEPGIYALRVGVLDTHANRALTVTQPDGSQRTRDTLQTIRVRRSTSVDLSGITRANVRFGNVELIGYTLGADNLLTTYWRAAQMPNADATMFVHLLDANGQTVTTFDAPPTNGLLPLSAWDKDEIVIDRRTLKSNADAARIALGLYDPQSSQRYSAQNTDGARLPDDQVVLPLTPTR